MKKYRENYDHINWAKKIPKTFKTSWGAEYTLMLPVKEEEKPDWTKYNSPTLQPFIEEFKKEKNK